MRIFISLLLALMSFASYGQGSTVYLRADTISVEKTGGNAELRIRNATRALTGAFLVNYGNGITGFKYAIDSVWKTGDTIRFRRGPGTLAVFAGGVPVNIYNSDGTLTETRTVHLDGNTLVFSDLLTHYEFGTGIMTFKISDADGDNYTEQQATSSNWNIGITSPTSNASIGGSAEEININVNGNGVSVKADSVWSSLVMIAPNFRTWNGWAELVEAGTSGGLIIKNSAGAIVGYHAGNAVMSTTHEFKEVNKSTISSVADAGVMIASVTDSSRPAWVDKYGGKRNFLLQGDAVSGGSDPLKLNISDTAAMLAAYLRKIDTAAMLLGYQKRCHLQTLTDGATVTWNYATSCEAVVTLGGNRTLSITNLPSNYVSYGTLTVNQDATGSRTLTLPATSKVINGGGGVITLTTTGSARDVISFRYFPTTSTFEWNYGKNYN